MLPASLIWPGTAYEAALEFSVTASKGNVLFYFCGRTYTFQTILYDFKMCWFSPNEAYPVFFPYTSQEWLLISMLHSPGSSSPSHLWPHWLCMEVISAMNDILKCRIPLRTLIFMPYDRAYLSLILLLVLQRQLQKLFNAKYDWCGSNYESGILGCTPVARLLPRTSCFVFTELHQYCRVCAT